MGQEVRVRNLDPEVAQALGQLAEAEGRTVESYVRQLLKDSVHARARSFPTAIDWLRAGFDEIHELIPGRQYLAWAAMRPFRITITRSISGEQPEWNTEIEEGRSFEDRDGNDVSVWSRAIEVADRHLGDSPDLALRDAIRWIASYAGVDAVSRAHKEIERQKDISPRFQRVVDALEPHIGGSKSFPRDGIVIWHTDDFDIYVNEVDEKHGALMVYRSGQNWSITNGKADYFPLDKRGAQIILDRLYELGVLRLSQLESQ